ncbi:MAG: glycosyltransferase [Bacteroidales bacterium]|nr:glycosyltransferase [Bacteroidales bacterium]
MKKTKLLFLHFDLGNGGAENVLVNLLNRLDKTKYDITLRTVFSGGVNRERLSKDVNFKALFPRKAFPGTSHIFKFIPNFILEKLFVSGEFDYQIAFLEEIPTRILGVSKKRQNCKRYAWYHNTVDSHMYSFHSFRSEKEFFRVYSNIDKIAFVSAGALQSFENNFKIDTPKEVVYNVCDFEKIKEASKSEIDIKLSKNVLNLCSVGRLTGQKGYHRLIKALGKINQEGVDNWHLYLIGDGPEKQNLESLIERFGLSNMVTLLGFKSNPHSYVAKMDFFVCSSYKEGYSTAVTESIVLGTPVLTTRCSGMEEIFGDSNCGLIVDNTQESLEKGLHQILKYSKEDVSRIKQNAVVRSGDFSTDSRVIMFEKFIGTYE